MFVIYLYAAYSMRFRLFCQTFNAVRLDQADGLIPSQPLQTSKTAQRYFLNASKDMLSMAGSRTEISELVLINIQVQKN